MRVRALVGVLSVVVGAAWGDDSLRGALEAIQRRQRDLSPSLYYTRPYFYGDGQPEDIGYGYQKSVAPNTAGVFEPVALPSSELGDRDGEEKAAEVRALEKLMLDYLEDSDNNEVPRDYLRRYPSTKRSIFREREDADFPEALQRLYGSEDAGKADEETPIFIPSSFRERLTENRKSKLQNAHALVRNFGGLNFEDKFGDNGEEDNDDYLSVLNSIWEKYRGEEDPEEITESDVEELMEYLNGKEDRKRQYGGSYSTGYDFFNSPLPWTKRASKKEAVELLRREGDDVGRMVLGYGRDNQHKKNYLQDVAFDERYPYRNVQKRFPITKRSPSYYGGTASIRGLDGQRRKKNSSMKQQTDPKVAEELNDIFSTGKKSSTPKPAVGKNESSFAHKVTEAKNSTEAKIGQKELSSENGSIKPLEVKKKSIDWSDYFGIDRRRKKSMRNDINDDWLLNQYLKAYSLGKQKASSEDLENGLEPILYETPKKRPEDMEGKLRALEDLIVDETVKYTGAHEGATDSKEVQEVKNRVMAQLAAAYSLEKMRKALGDFKSSIAAQKVSAPPSHSIPPPNVDKQDIKSKRIAVKKEKVDISPAEGRVEKKDNHELSNMIKDSDRDYRKEDFLDCPILQDMDMRCNQVGIISGDVGEMFQPLCTLHQICYLCGAEVGGASPRGCDARFLSEARAVCGEEPACYYTARRTLAALRVTKGDVTSQGCDWRSHPCLAHFLALAKRR